MPAVAFLGLCVVATAAGSQEPAFKVVVNAGVSVPPLTTKDVSRVFLKKVPTWPSGLRVTPVDLKAGHPTREAFSQRIHGKGTKPIERRWESLIFSGMEVPPVQLATEAEVVSFVQKNAGAIGYVATGYRLPPEVKELEIKS